jgi:PEGA domain
VTPEKQVKFTTLFEMAERARFGGRTNEAAILYEEALEIQFDPVLAGRFGLMLAKLGQIDQAAQMLHEAVTRGQGVSRSERQEVLTVYDKARAATAWVNVNISQSGAQITYDGKPFETKGFSSFWRFVMPGEHVLRAKLDGYEDAVETFTAKPGEEMTVSLNLVPLAGPTLPELPASVEVTVPNTRVFPPVLRASNVAGDPNYSAKEDPFYGEPKETKLPKKKTGPRFSISGGVVTVFGVASWNPAVGPVLGVGLRPNDYFSFGLEGRAAWLTTGVADREAISAMTGGGLLTVCGHLRWLLGCAVGHLGAINTSVSDVSYKASSNTHFKPGVGARIGVQGRLISSFVLRGNIDVLAFRNGHQIWIGGKLIVDQPPLLLGAQLLGEWEF